MEVERDIFLLGSHKIEISSYSKSCRNIIRPDALRGKVIKFDVSSGLLVTTALCLLQKIDVKTREVGIVIVNKKPNSRIIKEFVDSCNASCPSPSKFAASAINASSSFIAMAANIVGPSVTLCGCSAAYDKGLKLAINYIKRDDAKIMLMGVLDESLDASIKCIFYAFSSKN